MNSILRVRLSSLMFFEFFIWGCWLVPMWKYLYKIKFTDIQVASAYSTYAIAAMISPFFVGMVADRFFSAEKVLAFLHVASGFFLFYLAGVTDPDLFFWVLLGHTLCYMPTLALANSLSFDHVSDPEKDFPSIRVLGTIGWIASGFAIAYAPESLTGHASIADTPIPFQMAGAVSIALGLFCLTLPHTPPKSKGKEVSVSDVLGLKALGLMKEPSFAVFVIGSFLICIPLAFYYQSANGYVATMGLEESEAKMAYGQISEILFMLLMPWFFIRLGVKKMLLFGMACWVLRYALFAYAGDQTAALLAAIILHGICYDFFFLTGQLYVDRKAPLEIRASAQGFIAFVTLGAGLYVGTMVNGFVKDHYTTDAGVTDWTAVWQAPALMAAAVLVVFFFAFKEPEDGKDGADEKTA